MINRIMGVLKLDANTYEEIEADESATSQAAIVVAIVAIVGGLVGGALAAATDTGPFTGTFLAQLIGAFVGWIIWSGVTFFIGTTLFGGKATFGEMLRVLGFAQAPGLLAIIPVCGAFIGFLWTLATSFVAIRQGLDLDNGKAALTAIVAFIAVFVINLVIAGILGVGAAGLGAITG